MKISVTMYPTSTGNNLKAKADVEIAFESHTIMLFNFRVLDDGVKPAWVAMPQFEWIVDGKKHYKKVLLSSKALNKEICDAVMEQFNKINKKLPAV